MKKIRSLRQKIAILLVVIMGVVFIPTTAVYAEGDITPPEQNNPPVEEPDVDIPQADEYYAIPYFIEGRVGNGVYQRVLCDEKTGKLSGDDILSGFNPPAMTELYYGINGEESAVECFYFAYKKDGEYYALDSGILGEEKSITRYNKSGEVSVSISESITQTQDIKPQGTDNKYLFDVRCVSEKSSNGRFNYSFVSFPINEDTGILFVCYPDTEHRATQLYAIGQYMNNMETDEYTIPCDADGYLKFDNVERFEMNKRLTSFQDFQGKILPPFSGYLVMREGARFRAVIKPDSENPISITNGGYTINIGAKKTDNKEIATNGYLINFYANNTTRLTAKETPFTLRCEYLRNNYPESLLLSNDTGFNPFEIIVSRQISFGPTEAVKSTEVKAEDGIAEISKSNVAWLLNENSSLEKVTAKFDDVEITLNKDFAKAIESQIENNEITIEVSKENETETSVDYELTMKSGDTSIENFGEGKLEVNFGIPESIADGAVSCLYEDVDMTLHKIDGEVLKESKQFKTVLNHFSCYRITTTEAANAAISDGIKATGLKLTVKAYKGKKIKLSWKNSSKSGYYVDKYKIYRATKKNGKYKCIKTIIVSDDKIGDKSAEFTWTNNSKILKKAKKGTRYYYKIQGIRTVGVNDVTTKFSSKKSAKLI